jgi:CDP-glycerol glycerophosphotransferase
VAVLTVIVPVYGVEQYLRECLDSILGQTGEGWRGDEIEVVAVNDRSPDHSAEILAEYAAREPRLTVVTHSTNRGLGAARNSGLDHATGDYVWFVDSDDWLTPGALPAVVDRLRRTSPDILVVGYERCYPNGTVVPDQLLPSSGSRLFGRDRFFGQDRRPPAAAQLPEILTVRQEPRLLTTLHIACNKVTRRAFLLATGVRFADGWYEDVSFSHPLMLAAERIGVLPRVCYAYRQRPEGAITHTRTDRHNDVFDQWHRVMAQVELEQPDLRGPMFQRMIWHYLGVLNHPSRIDRELRRNFFARIVADFRAYRPPDGYPSPHGVPRVTFALVALNTFWLFEVLRTVYRSRSKVRAAGWKVGRRARRLYYRGQRHRSLAGPATVYAGASHQGYAGSPHARSVASVFEEARVHTADGQAVLVVKDLRALGPAEAATECYQLDTLRGLKVMARTPMLITDGPLPAGIEVRSEQRLVLLTGAPAVVPSARGSAETLPDNPAHVG